MRNTDVIANIAQEKAAIIEQIKILLDRLAKLDSIQNQNDIQMLSGTEKQNTPRMPIMLTIKECAKEIEGVGEYTIRQLVAQNKVKYFRTGNGGRSKVLVNRDSVIEYFMTVNGDHLMSKRGG